MNDDDILNVESRNSVARDYGDNDDTYNDTVPKYQIVLDEYNIMSPIEHEVNNEYRFWKTYDGPSEIIIVVVIQTIGRR